jgi:hypothetical protein
VHQIASHNYPVSSTFPALFGIYSWFFIAMLPARFSCRSCGTTFRHYTVGRALVLVLFGLMVILSLLVTILFG